MAEDRPPRTPYRPYSTRFDIETDATGLRAALSRKPFYITRVDSPSVSSEQRLEDAWSLLGEARRDDLRVVVADAGRRLSAAIPTEVLSDTALTLLLDHSGSMRGEKMQYAAAALDILQAMLSEIGIRVEILGFTTRFWRGGESRWWWKIRGRPNAPGRLNDLLHVVYRDAGESAAGETPAVYRQMLRPELLKENVDGEALQWAATRLRRRSQSRRILLVLSDGAPVDDSTLLANHTHYLEDHLLDVIAELEASPDILLAGLGIGCSVEHYCNAASVPEPDRLGEVLTSQLEQLLLEATAPAA